MVNPAALCLMGPTASGKSELALALARVIPVEIISVDSALVYRGMDIGTAKPSRQVRAGIPHHLIDIKDPLEAYSAADFRQAALALIREIYSRGKLPLLVGGTMLYFKALKSGLAVLPAANSEVRARISAYAKEYGWQAVHKQLQSVDPVAAARIHVNDPQRLQRALEVYEVSSKPITAWQQQGLTPCPYRLLELAVMPKNRPWLHQRIATRLDQMFTDGFLIEVQRLYQRQDLHLGLPAIKAVGYRQVWAYLAGKSTYGEMMEQTNAATRQLAKRQYTWLRSWQNLHYVHAWQIDQTLKIVSSSSILP